MRAFNDTHICLNELFSIKEGDTFQDFLNLVEKGDRPIVLKVQTMYQKISTTIMKLPS